MCSTKVQPVNVQQLLEATTRECVLARIQALHILLNFKLAVFRLQHGTVLHQVTLELLFPSPTLTRGTDPAR